MSSLGWTSLRHTESSLIVNVGELPPTHKTVFVLHFKGTSTMFYPRPCTTPDGTGTMFHLVLTLEDEVRQDLDLPRVVCEYEEVFPNKISGLPL